MKLELHLQMNMNVLNLNVFSRLVVSLSLSGSMLKGGRIARGLTPATTIGRDSSLSATVQTAGMTTQQDTIRLGLGAGMATQDAKSSTLRIPLNRGPLPRSRSPPDNRGAASGHVLSCLKYMFLLDH